MGISFSFSLFAFAGSFARVGIAQDGISLAGSFIECECDMTSFGMYWCFG